MDFNFSDEQQQLRDSLQRFMRKDYTFEQRRQIVASGEGWSRASWREFAELGWLAITLPEQHDGYGGNAVDTLLLMENMGRALVVEPYLGTVVLCGGLLRDVGTASQQATLLPRIADGSCLMALAHYEARTRYELSHVTTSARAEGDGYVLNGAKTVVLHGASADRLIVSARTAHGPYDEVGISLFVVDALAHGVSRYDYRTQDGQRAAELTFKDVVLGADALLGKEGDGFLLVERAIDLGIAALCAEALGCMDALIEQTVGHLQTRKQFGVPIGKFQVLQHRVADMFIHLEQARSMAYLAAVKVDSPDRTERRRAVSAAKALVGQAMRFVGQQAVQLHGGMGVTDELPVSHYFKRLMVINASFGDAEHHLACYSDLLAA